MINRRANLNEKVEEFKKLKKAVLADQPRVVQGKRNIRKLREARKLVDTVRGVLRKVDVRDIPDSSGRQIKYPRVEPDIRDFAIHLANWIEASVTYPEAIPAYVELRKLLSRAPTPESDVIDHCDLLAFLIQALLEIQLNVEALRASSLLEEDVDHHIEAAAWKAGLTGTNASELARIRCRARSGDDVRTFEAEVKAVSRRRTTIQAKIGKHREAFRSAVIDTLNGALRTLSPKCGDAAQVRSALADFENLPPEEETVMIKAWIVATEATGTENGFHDIKDLIARLRRAASNSKP